MVQNILEYDPKKLFDPTPVLGGPAGIFTITSTFTNISSSSIKSPFFVLIKLSGYNVLLNADEGSTVMMTPYIDDGILMPGESITLHFIIGLQDVTSFTLFVDFFGLPAL